MTTTQAPATRPIIFSGPMVRAILDGRKTQTRWVLKRRPPDGWTPDVGLYSPAKVDCRGERIPGRDVYGASDEDFGLPCPYGQPGDLLWVREKWGLHDTDPSDGPDLATVYFAATEGDRPDLRYQKWRPSIHMPRWASRITLKIVSVRVERLQEISESDAKAEGVVNAGPFDGRPGHIHRELFQELWNTINGKSHPWDANPWVWVVEFEKYDGVHP